MKKENDVLLTTMCMHIDGLIDTIDLAIKMGEIIKHEVKETKYKTWCGSLQKSIIAKCGNRCYISTRFMVESSQSVIPTITVDYSKNVYLSVNDAKTMTIKYKANIDKWSTYGFTPTIYIIHPRLVDSITKELHIDNCADCMNRDLFKGNGADYGRKRYSKEAVCKALSDQIIVNKHWINALRDSKELIKKNHNKIISDLTKYNKDYDVAKKQAVESAKNISDVINNVNLEYEFVDKLYKDKLIDKYNIITDYLHK